MRTSILLSAILLAKAINPSYEIGGAYFMLTLFVLWDFYDTIFKNNNSK